MARTNIPPTALPGAAGINEPAGTAIDVANGHTITPANGLTHRLHLRVNNTFAGAKTVTVKAGAYPPAAGSSGDLVVSCQASGVTEIGPFSSAKYVQADGAIYLDIQAAMTGFITAFESPVV